MAIPENLVLYQDTIPKLIIFLVLITCLLDSIKIGRRIYMLVTPGSERVKREMKYLVHNSVSLSDW